MRQESFATVSVRVSQLCDFRCRAATDHCDPLHAPLQSVKKVLSRRSLMWSEIKSRQSIPCGYVHQGVSNIAMQVLKVFIALVRAQCLQPA
jgi:hypothetical protein